MRMKIRSFIFLLGFILSVIIIVIVALCFSQDVNVVPRVFRPNSTQTNPELDRRIERETKLKNIERTVLERYPFLSEMEVHYYSIFFLEFSEKYDLPWEVLAALVRVESNFDPSQKSSKGAKGMTQVIEETGKKVALDLGIRYEEGKTLWNDFLNMIIGFTYFGQTYEAKIQAGGTVDEAIREAIGTYIGGPDFRQKTNGNKVYVMEYSTTVYQEYRTLAWMFKGVCAEVDSLETGLSE